MIKRSVYFLLGVALFLLVERFCHMKTEGFQCIKIRSDLTYNEKWEIPPLKEAELEQMRAILSQPFYFLGSGAQCYAFVSKDNQYVIKLFKHHHMRPRRFYDNIPLPSFLSAKRDQLKRQRIEELERVFSSFKISYDRFKERTGLIYIHLNKTDLFHQKMTIFDKIGAIHHLDIDSMEFSIQKKAELALPKIARLIKNQEIESAKRCLNSYLSLIKERCMAGIFDHDPVMHRNFGFIDEQAIEIDLGSFTSDEFFSTPSYYKRELYFETLKLQRWVKKRDPQLALFLDERIHNLMQDNLF